MNEMAITMMQKFWESALEPPDDSDSHRYELWCIIPQALWDFNLQHFFHSEMSAALMNSDGTEMGRYPSLGLGNSFSFKVEHPKGRVHRFNFGTYHVSPF